VTIPQSFSSPAPASLLITQSWHNHCVNLETKFFFHGRVHQVLKGFFFHHIQVYENMTVVSSSAQSFTILTEDDGIPGSKFETEPEYTVEQLKRWLKCRGLKQSRKRGELLNRV